MEHEGHPRYLETPLVYARVIDHLLGPNGEGISDISKPRKRCREMLGLGEFKWASPVFSLGGRGRVAFELEPVYACVQTARRWGYGYAERLAESYRQEGLPQVAKSPELEDAVGRFGASIQEAFKKEQPPPPDADYPSFLASYEMKLMREDDAFRETAEQLAQVGARVAKAEPAVSRVAGRVLRYESVDVSGQPTIALVVEYIEGREVTRVEDPRHFIDSGLIPGDCYVRTMLRWTGDNVARVLVPALAVGVEEGDALREKLRSDMGTIPQPPDDWPGWTR